MISKLNTQKNDYKLRRSEIFIAQGETWGK